MPAANDDLGPLDRRLLWLSAALIAVVAVLARGFVIDPERLLAPATAAGPFPPGSAFDGHERGYVRAFLGQMPDPSMEAWPLLTGLYRWLGLVSHDPRLLVAVSVLAGALAAVLVGWWTAERFGAAAGLWAGLCVALLPEHVAWSTSAYNVILPHLFLVAGFVARRRPVAALWLVLAVSLRVELVLLALWRGRPGLVALPVAALWLWVLPAPHVSQPLLALACNLPLVAFIGPPVLLLGLLALPGSRPALAIAGFVLFAHVVGASFADYGPRHALAGGTAACVLVGIAGARWRGLPGVVGMAFLGLGTASLAGRWYQPAPANSAFDDLFEPVPADCLEISDEPPIAGQARPSWMALAAGELDAPCITWGEDPTHRAWTSRSLGPRAVRMHGLYRLEPMARRPDPGGAIDVYRLHPRWPLAWGMP